MAFSGTINIGIDAPWGGIRPVYWNGYNYFAISNGGQIWLYKLDSNVALNRTVIGSPNLLPQSQFAAAFPAVIPSDSSSLGEAYFFFPGLYTVDNTGCVYYTKASDPKMKLLAGKTAFFSSLAEAQSCSVAYNAYGITLVTLRGTSGTPYFHCSLIKWEDIETGAQIKEFDVAFPPPPGTVVWTDAMYVLGTPDNTTSDQETVLVLTAPVMKVGSTSVNPEGWLAGEVIVDTTGDSPIVINDSTSWTWIASPEYSSINAGFFSALNMGIDGRIYNTVSPLWTTVNSPQQMNPELWRREGKGQWNNQGYIKSWTGTGGFPGIVYVPGLPEEEQSTANSDLDDSLTPVERLFLYPGPMSNKGTMTMLTYWGDNFGYLQRLGLEQLPGLQKLLFGIIEGPPPIPNENLNIPNSQDPSMPLASGVTTFSDAESSSAGYNINVKAGLVYQREVEGGVGGMEAATASFNMSGGYQYSEQHDTTTTSGVSYSCEVRLEQDPSTTLWEVQRIGAAVLLGMDMAGYTYQYISPDGTRPDDSPAYTQIFPTEITVTTYPYVMNPNTGPTPGQLLSYEVTPEQLTSLKENASFTITTAGMPTPNLVTAWGLDTKTVTTWQKYESSQYSNGFYFDLKAMVGAKFDEGWVKTDTSVGVQFHMEGNWTHGTSSTIGLSTQVSTRGNVQAVGTYSYYDYYTFQLTPSYQWAQDFLDSLVTDSWPTDPYELQMNQKLKEMIATLSPDLNGGTPQGPAPWKICYALGAYQYISPITEAAQSAGVSLSPELSSRLDRAAIHTTAQLQQVLSTSRQKPFSDPTSVAQAETSDLSLTEDEIRLLERVLSHR